MGATTNEVSRIREAGDHPYRRAVAPAGQAHLPARRTLDQLGIARRTFYRWYDRYLQGGPEALEDRPSAPSRVWNRIGEDIQDQIVEMALDHSELSPRELGDCQDFRVWAGIMGKKESHYVPTQGTGDTG